MNDLKYSEILAKNKELAGTMTAPSFDIGIFSNVTVNQLGEILEYSLRANGLNARVAFGDYGNILQNSTSAGQHKSVILFWEIANLLEDFHARADGMDDGQLEELLQRTENEITLTLDNLKSVPLVLVNRFSALLFSGARLRPGTLEKACRRLNSALEARADRNLLLVDLDAVIAEVGIKAAADLRQFLNAKAPYTVNFFKAYAAAVAPAFLSAAGKMRKVLIMDCDNTLWGGIIGEDGLEGIKIDDTTREGKVFREVHYILQGFKRKGILLAICSKNEAADVHQAFREHPSMILREDDFVAERVNWIDKASNLRALADELNLGLDSFVFVDDSKFELGLIQKELPQVKCVLVPPSLSEYPAAIRSLEADFFTLQRTKEDLKKTDMYLEEKKRRGFVEQFSNVEEYLKALKLKISIFKAGDVPVARAAQLTQKTNQFNLTTRRYTEAEISQFLADPNRGVFAFSVTDQFGDYGVCGLGIVKHDPANRSAEIDTLLMSCRVIGRRIESAFLDYIITDLKKRGVESLTGYYLPTKKNAQVADFYDKGGFHKEASGADRQAYTLNLKSYRPQAVDFIEIREGVFV